MRILFVSNWFPYPPDNGTRQRNYNLIKQLSKNNEVALISAFRGSGWPDTHRLGHLKRYCQEVYFAPRLNHSGHTARSVSELTQLRPPWITQPWNVEIARMVVEVLNSFKPDLILLSEILNLPIFDEIALSVPVVLEQFEVGVLWQRVDKAQGLLKLRRKAARALLTA